MDAMGTRDYVNALFLRTLNQGSLYIFMLLIGGAESNLLVVNQHENAGTLLPQGISMDFW